MRLSKALLVIAGILPAVMATGCDLLGSQDGQVEQDEQNDAEEDEQSVIEGTSISGRFADYESPASSTRHLQGRAESTTAAEPTPDRVIALPVTNREIFIGTIRNAPSADIEADGSFDLSLPEGDESYVVMAIDTGEVGFDAVAGFIAIGSDTANLNVFPVANVEGDLQLGQLVYDSESGDFVGEFDLDTYSSDLNLTVEELRQLARADGMAKRMANLYINDTGTSYWIPSTGYTFHGSFADAVEQYASAADLSLQQIYMGLEWFESPFGIDDVENQPVVIELYPPDVITHDGKTWGPEHPFSNTGAKTTQNSPDGIRSITYEGGLTVGNSVLEDVLVIHPEWADGGTGEPLRGIWTVRVDGTVRGYFDFFSGSPYDSEGRLYPLIAEPRVRFNDNGSFQSFDVRFVQYKDGTYVPSAMATDRVVQFAQLQIHGDGNVIEIYNHDREVGYFWESGHESITRPWHHSDPPPDGYETLFSVVIETVMYGTNLRYEYNR